MMSNREQPPTENSAANHNSIGSPRNFVLACIGFVSLLADELPALLERSVQRGNVVLERAQREARPRRAASPTVVTQRDQAVDTELSRRGLPTHHDFELLLQQVAELEQQIDQIAAQRSATT